MFLIEILSSGLLLNFMPEQGALLLCGISLIGGAAVARRFLKYQSEEKKSQNIDVSVEDK